ncbi:MAG: AraC family transcriptional regulator [Lacrimispora celerecrescens]|uniref:AraC family transcriptional regulator n=1 Tax=Lacrimispora indolis TaxID=69825 RepID=UPI00040C4590|nr:AraC family transcriptional regulator [[Clostridium] methoxybenzovorans]MBE7721579.1 AraC family transcriptional regulator [Lacrimispora celerecrescens]
MNTLAQFNDVMAYIERNLMHDMEPGQISRISGCSEYHFRRMFSFLAGMPLGEYIRRRRLSVAGLMLQKESVKVIDLALQLGYESPEAFSKAFQVMHGVTPSQAKKENTELKVLPPMTFQLTITGGMEMNYRVVEKDEFHIVGFKKRITMQFKGINPQMDSLVQKLTPQVIEELKGLCDVEPKGILSVSADFNERTTEGSQLDQYIGVATSKAVSNGYDILDVPASNWAVFKAAGTFPDAIQDTWAKIYSEWFPASGYELTGGPELLWNETPDTSKPDYKSEIWIPVRKIDGK